MSTKKVLPTAEAPLVARLLDGVFGLNRIPLCVEAAHRIQQLTAALELIREYPEFDEKSPFTDMMDQVLAGEPAPLLEMVDKLSSYFK